MIPLRCRLYPLEYHSVRLHYCPHVVSSRCSAFILATWCLIESQVCVSTVSVCFTIDYTYSAPFIFTRLTGLIFAFRQFFIIVYTTNYSILIDMHTVLCFVIVVLSIRIRFIRSITHILQSFFTAEGAIV